jgi:hypothetical protein
MIDWTHFIPGIGFFVAADSTFEAVEKGEMSPVMGGAYLGTLAFAETAHGIHAAQVSGRVSPFAIAHVKRMQFAWWIATHSPQIAVSAAPFALAAANVSVIQSAPEEQQRGMWQMFSSGLTGTFGIGSGLSL